MTSRPTIGLTLDGEPSGYRFRLGVQWHPEYALSRDRSRWPEGELA